MGVNGCVLAMTCTMGFMVQQVFVSWRTVTCSRPYILAGVIDGRGARVTNDIHEEPLDDRLS